MKEYNAQPPETPVAPQSADGPAPQDGRFKNLVVEGVLTVKHPDGKGSITMMADGTTTGVWVQNGVDQQNIGVYAQSNGGLAISIWGPGDKHLPRFAVGVHGDAPADLQVVPPGAAHPHLYSKVKMISMADIVRLVEEHGHSPNPTPQ